MPLDRADAICDLSDPNVVVGPRKRRPTERLLENGDPLSHRKVRKVSAAVVSVDAHADKDKENHTLSSTLSILPGLPPAPRPTRPPAARPTTTPATVPATEGVESTSDPSSDGPEAIVVEGSDDEETDLEGSDGGEATDEDDDAELGT